MDPQIAWAAGLFEGEGSITHTTANGKQYPRLSLAMKDKDVVERFAEVVGYGKVAFKKRQKENWSDVYQWAIVKASEVQRILDMFLPYFGNRRAYKALNALDAIEL